MSRWIRESLRWTTLLALPLVCLSGTAAEPAKTMASAVRPFVDSHTLAGAVMLMASTDKVLSLEAAGWSDIAARKPMKTDGLFWIASQSKPMTAAALMMLVDEGKPNQDKIGLEETTVTQLRHPLSNRANRYPMPAGGLFSTAIDTAQFCRMILNGGILDGKRLLSEAAVQQLTRRQTAPDIKDSYGLGFAVGMDWCGHGGAYATNMQIDRRRGLVLVWMVQHNGFPGNGGKSQDAFKQAVVDLFAR